VNQVPLGTSVNRSAPLDCGPTWTTPAILSGCPSVNAWRRLRFRVLEPQLRAGLLIAGEVVLEASVAELMHCAGLAEHASLMGIVEERHQRPR
jgi:hypothetical protein